MNAGQQGKTQRLDCYRVPPFYTNVGEEPASITKLIHFGKLDRASVRARGNFSQIYIFGV